MERVFMNIPSQMYIDGEWVDASDGAVIEVINPADETVVHTVPAATEADLDRALAAADRAWKQWREVDAWTRSAKLRAAADWLRAHREEIADVLTDEQGKTTGECLGEIGTAADQFDWYADEARRIYGRVIDAHSRNNRLLVIRQPVGPVAAFSPEFSRAADIAQDGAAIAAGCSIIVKPPRAPGTALYLARACEAAEIPPGVVNMVTGKSSFISRHLIASDIIRKVSLTGSVPIGRELLRQCVDGIKAVSMELGGHAPVLVFEDADVETAAEICARGTCRNNGQVCIAASRFFVQESVAERYTEKFVAVVKAQKMGRGKDPGTDVGPLANRRRLETTEALVADALAKGAQLRCGGKRPEGFDKGFWYEPTVLTGVDGTMRIMREEPFCPVAPIATFTTLEDGLAQANATEFGLAGYVFTKSTRTAVLASEGIEAGMIGVNTILLATAEIPFGGVKHSGYGREGGSEGILDYTVAKHINIQL